MAIKSTVQYFVHEKDTIFFEITLRIKEFHELFDYVEESDDILIWK